MLNLHPRPPSSAERRLDATIEWEESAFEEIGKGKTVWVHDKMMPRGASLSTLTLPDDGHVTRINTLYPDVHIVWHDLNTDAASQGNRLMGHLWLKDNLDGQY